ncbi:hypothetical protein [Olivibacter sp. XZL3]|uniref:CBU_0592 family membrane protein n=1 Tax=Olivibacter sp. XZL3 TaxID=1735116 RepID=UPI001064E585|nr:hypothetical protein [Olivibacter sp. XZL3]
MHLNVIDALGWLGVILCLLAYLLISYDYIRPDDRMYQMLNIAGASGLAVNALYYHDRPNVLVNVLWALIALSRLIPWRRLIKLRK